MQPKIPPKLTPSQLKTWEVIQRVRMQWTALTVVLSLLVAASVAFGIALFKTDQWLATTILGGFDVMLAVILFQVYRSLFPAPK